jgi:hypothetical protein
LYCAALDDDYAQEENADPDAKRCEIVSANRPSSATDGAASAFMTTTR